MSDEGRARARRLAAGWERRFYSELWVDEIEAALTAARAEGEAAGRAALQVKLATAIQNCQLHRDDPEADESYFDGKERAYQNVLAWLREADRRPPIGPRG
jgi:hypothetical protein